MSQSLRSLSDSDVLSRTLELTRRERSVTLQVLLHLNEIERRKLHLQEGYSSLFDYCTSRLGYSAPAAVRRIQTARSIDRFPEVYALLETNEVSLSTVSQVSRVLKHHNKDAILARIRGKSHREVKAIAAEYQPCALPLDEVRPIAVLVKAPVAAPAPSVNIAAAATDACENSDYIRCGCALDVSTRRPSCPGEGDGAPQVRIEPRKVFKFTATEGFEKKFERIKSLAWHRLGPNPSFEQIFELAMDCFLEKEDPVARREHRERRSVRARAASTRDRGTRYVSAAVRDQVFVRDEGRCAFVGRNGRRCASAKALQIDHITPVARGGANTADNLRLLCAYHNRLEAERLMGISITDRATKTPSLRR